MNPMLSLLGGAMGNGGGRNAIFAKALAAMASGKTAEEFMSDLAKTDSRFQGIDVSNLEATANQLCQQKGVDPNSLTAEVQNELKGLT